MKHLNCLNLLLAVLVSVASLLAPQSSYSAQSCVDVFSPSKAAFSISSNRAYENARYTKEDLEVINKFLVSKDLKPIKELNAAKAAEKIIEQVEKKFSGKTAANLVGSLSLKIYPRLATRPYPEKLKVMSTLVDVVSHFESWKKEDFINSPELAMIQNDIKFLRTDDLQPYIESYVLQDGGIYQTDIPNSGKGILGFKDIRDAASHNLWVVEQKGHDIRHGHFLLGHPYAANAYFRAARSKNPMRYTIMGGLFEGVDTLQFSWESRITSHFQEKQMKLEEAMLYMGMIPQSKISALKNELGLSSGFNDALEVYKAYKPRAYGKFTKEGRSGVDLNADLKQIMEHSYDLLQNPDMTWLTNYSPYPSKGGNRTNDDDVH